MKAVVFDFPGEADVLKLADLPVPAPGEKHIRIKVAAAGVNRADILQRRGKYPPPAGASSILGLEVSGIVESIGKGCTKWKAGDKVMGLLSGGGYAEYVVMHEDMAIPVPFNIHLGQAAAIPEAFLTAFQSLVWLAHTQARETVLIHAGASGVGTAAIQLALALDAVPIVTASKEKHNLCNQLGARAAIDYKVKDFVVELKNITNDKGVDVIIDFIGAPYFKKNLEILRADGRLVLLAAMGGFKVEEFNLLSILSKRVSVMGSTLRARSIDYQIKLTNDFWAFSKKPFADGALRPVIDKMLPFSEVGQAHQLIEENKTAGKIVLKIDEALVNI